MATRFASPVVRRAQVPLTEDDLFALEQLSSESSARQVLASRALVPAEGTISESALLHAILQAGIKAVRDARDEVGYDELAHDSEHLKHDFNVRSHRELRRPPRHAADA